jgi:hypothetical protein
MAGRHGDHEMRSPRRDGALSEHHRNVADSPSQVARGTVAPRDQLERLLESIAGFIATAMFPKLARYPARLGRRGLALYIAGHTLVLFAALHWLLPKVRRMADEHDRKVDELRQRLGREPNERRSRAT